MIVLKILGITFAVILLLIILVFCLPIDIVVLADDNKGFQILYRFLGRSYGQGGNADNIFVKGVKKAVGVSHLDSVKKIKTTAESRGTAVTIKETAEVLMAILNRIVWMLKRCKITKCEIISVSAGDDAAINYGVACAVIYPIVGYIKSNFKINERRLNLQLSCDYLSDEPSYSINVQLRIRIVHIASALFYVIKQNLKTKGVV